MTASRFASTFLILLAVAVAGYWDLFGHSLCFDDQGVVLGNRFLLEGQWRRLLTTSYWQGVTGQPGGLYRPLFLSLLAAERAAFGDRVAGYHTVGLLFHTLGAAILVAAAATWWRSRWGWALASGALFCLHPAATEVVNAVVGTADALALVLGLWGALWLCQSRSVGARAAVGGALLALAALAKENAVVFAAGAFLAGVLHGRARPWVWLLAALAAVVPTAGRWWVTGHLGAGAIGFLDNPLAYAQAHIRMANGMGLVVRYLRLLAIPWPLSADYSYDQIPVVGDLLDGRVLAPGALVVTAALLGLRLARRTWQGALWVGVAASCLGLASHLVVPIGAIFAERLAYPATAAFALASAWGLAQLSRRRAIATAACWLVLFGLLSRQRTADWADDGTLFASAVITSPRSARSHYGLGHWRHEAGDLEAALEAYDRALSIYPRYTDALYNRGAALLSLGRNREALAAYEAASASRPGHVAALYAAAVLTEALEGPDAARGAYESVLAAAPRHADAARALAQIRLGRADSAGARSVWITAFGDSGGALEWAELVGAQRAHQPPSTTSR